MTIAIAELQQKLKHLQTPIKRNNENIEQARLLKKQQQAEVQRRKKWINILLQFLGKSKVKKALDCVFVSIFKIHIEQVKKVLLPANI